jgi:guanylate kinase
MCQPQEAPKKGKLVALSAPSGAGKSTIAKFLLERNPDFKLSISATTRPPRFTETHGVDYYFMSKEEFLKRVERGEFLEYEEVHGNYYGTLKATIDELLSQGATVILDIDVNGALNIKKHYPDALLIFIKPPSIEELRRRLMSRKTETPESIEKRLQRLPLEYEKAEKFDVQVINDNLEETIQKIEEIIKNHQ